MTHPIQRPWIHALTLILAATSSASASAAVYASPAPQERGPEEGSA